MLEVHSHFRKQSRGKEKRQGILLNFTKGKNLDEVGLHPFIIQTTIVPNKILSCGN